MGELQVVFEILKKSDIICVWTLNIIGRFGIFVFLGPNISKQISLKCDHNWRRVEGK